MTRKLACEVKVGDKLPTGTVTEILASQDGRGLYFVLESDQDRSGDRYGYLLPEDMVTCAE